MLENEKYKRILERLDRFLWFVIRTYKYRFSNWQGYKNVRK